MREGCVKMSANVFFLLPSYFPMNRSPLRFVVALALCSASVLCATPEEDLASPSQEVRDAAAKQLRETYVLPTLDHIKPAVSTIHLGDRRSKVLQALRPFNIPLVLPDNREQTSLTKYRLDDRWVLQCSFVDDVLQDLTVLEDVRTVAVEPLPKKKFTGVWTTYYVNGQPWREVHLEKGAFSGDYTTFHPNGAKCRIQHFGPDGEEGEEVAYTPTGEVAYRGNYHAGVRVGVWTWYKEDGTTVDSTEDYGSGPTAAQ